ncbi:acetamidase/formamidase family protein [Peribacillus deserti]|uniref:Acetamidase n=1 Tax=Peribacillus deserti TaxID=673318 RepID=A0A2N5M7U8_9BACI|nr:acetamidase/formamidase family protein [Peribacillus deserti]PLT30444.1 acetamidase [Peribacillus deserti]
MAELLTKENVIFAFSRDNKPVKHIKPGTEITIETYDCYSNQITPGNTMIDRSKINPATGPIYIETAEPGDVLRVNIERIEISEEGVMSTGPNLGVMGDQLEKHEVKFITIKNQKALFNENIEIPLNPMIGVIGVAPEGGPAPTGTPGPHGGNMDTKLIEEGAVLYLPVACEGALFALGDMHAALGDGEIGISGIEVSGKATVTLDIIKTIRIKHPILTNNEGLSLIVSAGTLDEAVKHAVEEMVEMILPHTNLSMNHLTMLFSAIGQTQISQVVNPLVTARFFLPRYFLEAYNINFSMSEKARCSKKTRYQPGSFMYHLQIFTLRVTLIRIKHRA